MRNISTYTLLCSVISSASALAANTGESFSHAEQQKIDAQQQQLQQTQEQVRQATFADHREVRVETPVEKSISFPKEEKCFPIKELYLTELHSEHPAAIEQLTEEDLKTDFDWALKAVYAPKDFQLPYCVGEKGISEIIKRIQNAIINKGYVTTRVLAQPQDLRTQKLILTVVPGKVRHIILRDHSQPKKALRGTVWSALPVEKGDILNIRDVEQGLENLRRPAHTEANIQIVPPQEGQSLPGDSDLLIDFKQHFPYHLTLSLDDSGSKATGRLQAGATASVENLFSLNDVFYASWTQSIRRHSDDPGRRGSRNGSLYYSVPWKNWLFNFSMSENRYYQTIFGAFTNYEYSGRSVTSNLGVSRVLYRDNSRKTTANFGFWHRRSANYIDGAEIDIQRRRMAGWYAGLSHREYIGKATLDFSVNYKQGTGAYKSIPAPEERFDEGTSRPRIITALVRYKQPFTLGNQPWQFQSSWQAQWNRTPLILQDMFSIGGRYTVRGFDGELTLMGEHGWVWRNEVGWNVLNKGQEVYLAIDVGHVGGPYTKELLGNSLIGAALGVRGNWKGLSYEWFVGTPLDKPQGFRTSKLTTGFNLSYQF